MLTRSNNYTFGGSPIATAAAVAANRADRQAEGQIGAAQAQAQGAALAAQQNALANLYDQPANAYTAYAGSNAAGNNAYQQGLGTVATSQGGLYQNYNTALANLYNSQMTGLSNAETARMGSMGTAEAARQIGLANLGTSALSAGGQASGAALGAWAQNQGAFAKAMADAAAANQMAASQYGVGRDAALASLGTSASNYGTGLNKAWTDAQASMNNYSRDLNKLGVARDLGLGQLNVSSQIAGNMPATISGAVGGIGNAIGGAMSQFTGEAPPATTPQPTYPISTQANLPSYGWSATQYDEQPGNLALDGLSRGARDTFGQLAAARRGVQNTSVLDSLNANSAATRDQLDSAYYSSRNMPSQMLAQSLGGFDSMMRTAGRGLNRGMDQFYSGVNSGMNQFYGNLPRGYEGRMREGLQMGSRDLNATGAQMGGAFRDAMAQNSAGYQQFGSQLNDMMNRTNVMTDLQRQRMQYQMQDEAAARRDAARARMAASRQGRPGGTYAYRPY